mmetsp:Transcript_5683/g.8600  ORF Transcript_5683/g.8600 Transcript_5683/m.8600 type:complete len:223 (-) Transcript_5683:281-949(-)
MTKKVSSKDIFCYWPNLVGYARIFFATSSFLVALHSWKLCLAFYFIAFSGDLVDGWLARKFNQSTTFGAVLDMATDRCSTAGLLAVLSHLYPAEWVPAFVLLIVVDISSHWVQVFSSTGKSHKDVPDRNLLLRLYYGVYLFFGYCCVGTEVFYLLLYVLAWGFDPVFFTAGGVGVSLWHVCFFGCFPACAIKQIVNIAQLLSASVCMAKEDAERINAGKKEI